MSGRRLPLASNPNAANSPYRAVTAAASKQKRSYATIQREEAYGQPPPAKKQMLASHHQDLLRTPPRQQSTQSSLEGRVFTRKSNTSQQSSFEKQCIAVSEKPQQAIAKADKNTEENLETVRTWQKHYRKLFPTFTFYFEGVPVDIRTKYSKLVIELGAVRWAFLRSTTWMNVFADVAYSARKSSSRTRSLMLSLLGIFLQSTQYQLRQSPPLPTTPALRIVNPQQSTHHFLIDHQNQPTHNPTLEQRQSLHSKLQAVEG
jgi:hypothetical protein